MKSENIPFGKRLVSNKAETMYYRYPESGETETLPAGKPSPIIESYVLQKGGFYALSKKGSPRNIYLKDTDSLQVVPADAEDRSGFFSGLFFDVSDFFTNTGEDASSTWGHIKTGLNEAGKDIKKWVPSGPGAIKEIILWVSVPIAAILILMLLNNLSE